MAGQIEAYRQEIFDFLRTVSIKFEPFAYLMGQTYMETYGLEDPHGEWNPYYLNLSGEYAPNDTRMTVYSPETGEYIPFNKDTFKLYPKTAALYRLPNNEYRILEERYPENKGLIRAIAYPTGDIQDILAAPNLSLLGYDSSLLHINERESMVRCLHNFLEMVRNRWWVVEYTYEDMYAVTFWAMLWQALPTVLLTQRFKNIRTPYVHPFHVWEYLKGKGLGDYRDVLSNNQSLWLYRNINYILKNQGKNKTLRILAENLLEEIAVSLLYKNMQQETATNWDELRTTPIFRSYNLVTGEEVMDESFDTLNLRLVNLDYEHRDDPTYVEQTEEDLGMHIYNELPTKYLELKKEPINTQDERMMTNFFWDSLCYRISCGDMSYSVKVLDPVTNILLEEDVKDILILCNYAYAKSMGETPTVIPHQWLSHMAFQRRIPRAQDIRQSVYYASKEYPLRSLINQDGMITLITWWDRPYPRSNEFINHLATQFQALVYFRKCMEESNDYLYHSAMASFFYDTMIHETVDLWEEGRSYSEWISNHGFIQTVLRETDAAPNPQDAYRILAEKCVDAIFPLDQIEGDFRGSVQLLEKMYTSVRDLFIKLGGYNVTYLEIDRDIKQYLKVKAADFVAPKEWEVYMANLWRLQIELQVPLHCRMGYQLPAGNLHLELPILTEKFDQGWKYTLENRYEFVGSISHHIQRRFPVSTFMENKSLGTYLRGNVRTAVLGSRCKEL